MTARHIQHPYENKSLTFQQLRIILKKLGLGELECHEKVDGINLLVTWDEDRGEVRAARNKTQIKEGGVGRTALSAKFDGRGPVKDAIVGAYDALQTAFSSLASVTRSRIFGATGGLWYSVDIVYPEAYNFIKYDNNHIVFHKFGLSLFDWDGNQTKVQGDRYFDMLMRVMPHLNEKTKHTGWTISGPSVVSLKPLGPILLDQYLTKFDNVITGAGMSNGSTINEYLRKRLSATLSSLMFVPHNLKDKVLDRILGLPGAPGIREMSKGQVQAVKDHIRTCLGEGKKKVQAAMFPIEHIVYEITTAMLADCPSGFVEDSKAEVERMKSELERSMSILLSKGDMEITAHVNRHMKKLGSSARINTPVEGVVFKHYNDLYKITGTFAPANQIHGYLKYKMKPKEEKKSQPLGIYVL